MSRIINRQRQLAEAGRLRLGYTAPTSNGKTRPVRSETWIFTSHDQEKAAAAAELWGGDVERWQPLGNGAEQWRVITTATSLDAILPPGDPLTQAYETWSKGGAQRRCDGGTEQFSGNPCLCIAQFGEQWYEQPKGRVCDTKSRLKVLIPDLPGLGSYRLETGSFYAADEIAGMVDFIRSAVGEQTLVPVRLRIEPRTRVAGGETKHFVVPVVELRGVTTGELLSGSGQALRPGGQGAIGFRSQAAIEAPRPDYAAEAAQLGTVEDVRELWKVADSRGHLSDAVRTALVQRVEDLKAHDPAPPADVQAEVNAAHAAGRAAEPDWVSGGDPGGDVDGLWLQCVAEGGRQGMTTDQLKDAYAQHSGGLLVDDADSVQLAEFLAALKAGQVAA